MLSRPAPPSANAAQSGRAGLSGPPARPTSPVMTHLAALPDRAVIEVSGADRVAFLQGIVSNDVALVAPGRAVWAALLTPQGKWLADFFMLADAAAERLLLDVEAAQADMLAAKLSRFRLRAHVTIARPELCVLAAWDGTPHARGLAAAPDPRLPAAGWRILASVTDAPAADATSADWDAHRLALGLPDGSRDLEPEKSVLLEAGFEELGGVSWTKGCYMGQELTARTHYRGLVKRRLLPVVVTAGALPPPGAAIRRDGAEVGVMRSGRAGRGLALLRVDALAGALDCEGAVLEVRIPSWARLPEAAVQGAT